MGEPALRLLTTDFPEAKLVAAGKKAGLLLEKLNIEPAATVRHPANGGAGKFKAGMAELITSHRKRANP